VKRAEMEETDIEVTEENVKLERNYTELSQRYDPAPPAPHLDTRTFTVKGIVGNIGMFPGCLTFYQVDAVAELLLCKFCHCKGTFGVTQYAIE